MRPELVLITVVAVIMIGPFLVALGVALLCRQGEDR